ncbi:MAG: hypothetical protein RMM07_14225, partial [Anaerolineae bacterium]|nr:hypothetical protein [Anaerolineae bacterium]
TQNIDTLVLGCTHYPFVIPLLEKICGPGVRLIDPAPAVARQTARVAGERLQVAEGKGRVVYFTSGEVAEFERALERLGIERGEVCAVTWSGTTLRLARAPRL